MSELKYKRILLKISGEALMGNQQFGIAPEPVAMIAKEIKIAHDAGAEIGIVVGGGNIFRGGQKSEQLGMDRDSVSVEVLENAKTGFLGIGACPAKVKVTFEVPDETPVAAPAARTEPAPALSSASRKPKKQAPRLEKKPEAPQQEKKTAPKPEQKPVSVRPNREKARRQAPEQRQDPHLSCHAHRHCLRGHVPQQDAAPGVQL